MKLKFYKNKNHNISGTFEYQGKSISFETQADFNQSNKESISNFIKYCVDQNNSRIYIEKELSRIDDQLIRYSDF